MQDLLDFDLCFTTFEYNIFVSYYFLYLELRLNSTLDKILQQTFNIFPFYLLRLCYGYKIAGEEDTRYEIELE